MSAVFSVGEEMFPVRQYPYYYTPAYGAQLQPMGGYFPAMGRKSERPGVCLFVFHLPPEIKDQDLFELFSQCGMVHSVKIIQDHDSQQSKGYGFVNMATPADAQSAILHLNGHRVGNKYLKVSLKKKKF